MIRFISGIILTMATLVGAYVIEGGSVLALLALTCFLITFLVPGFAMLAVWDLKTWARAWSNAFKPGSPGESKTSIALWSFLEQTSYLAGVMAFILGGILILGSPATPAGDFLRPLGVNLIAPLYGTFFGLVAKVLKARVARLAE